MCALTNILPARQLKRMVENAEEEVRDPVVTEASADAKCVAANKADARGLLLIGLFKLSKAAFFVALGAGALHLVHKDLGDEVMRFAPFLNRVEDALRIDAEKHLVNVLMDKADAVSAHRLRLISWGGFGYAALCVVEGIGLMLRKVWAEYLTVTLTIAAMPYELYEMGRHYTPLKLGVFVSNVLLLLYLLWLLRRKRQRERVIVDLPLS